MAGCGGSGGNAGPPCTVWCTSPRSRGRCTTFGPSRKTRCSHSRTSRRSWCSLATAPYNCFAVAAPGLEPLVAEELKRLGEQPRTEDGGVAWRGDAHSLMRANLWLRTASRVVVRVATFRATAFFELEKRAKRLPWRDFLTKGRGVDFRVTAHKSRLYHSDAIAQRLVAASGEEDRDDGQLFVVRVVRDELT